MALRDAYRGAMTPEYADFAHSRSHSRTLSSSTPSARRSSLTYDHDKVVPLDAASTSEESIATSSKIWSLKAHQGWMAVVVDIMKKNSGLLLITASQAFGAVTNISVKLLNQIDPPISTLQVSLCFLTVVLSELMSSAEACSHSNGAPTDACDYSR